MAPLTSAECILLSSVLSQLFGVTDIKALGVSGLGPAVLQLLDKSVEALFY